MPTPWPPTVDDVKRELRIVALTPDAQLVMQSSLDAAVAYVEDNRPDLWTTAPDGESNPVFFPSDRVHKGTVRYAGRLYSRSVNQPGIEASTELGTPPTYALDADIAQLLGVLRYRRPSVG